MRVPGLIAASPVGVAIATALFLTPGTTAQGASLMCQTINGRTQCFEGQGSLSCTTVNGRTVCERSGDLTPVDPKTVPEGRPEAPPEGNGTDSGLSIDVDGSGVHIRMGGLPADRW